MATTFYGNIPAGTAGINDLFGALSSLKWKGIGFPYASLRNRFRQDLAIHKFVDRDGAHIEGTGRAPLEFSARVPFLNGLTPASSEDWPAQLYPTVRDAMLRACADKASGTLQHPELGNFTCKLETFEWTLDAQVRSGVWADVSWIETDDTGDDLQAALQQSSPTSLIQSAAFDLDSNIANVDPSIFPQPYVPPTSFSDLAFAIRGVTDIPTLLQKQVGGQIANYLYEAQSLEDSVNNAKNALLWPITQSAEVAKSALYDLEATLLTQGKPAAFYTVQKDSTLAQIAATVGAQVIDIMTLNPSYIQSPVIAAGSVVRYYQ